MALRVLLELGGYSVMEEQGSVKMPGEEMRCLDQQSNDTHRGSLAGETASAYQSLNSDRIYMSAKSTLFSSALTESTGQRSQNGATWRQALSLQINSGFASGTPPSMNYKGPREGREKGGWLPRIKGVGRTGKAPARVPSALVEAAALKQIEDKIRELKWVSAEDVGKALNAVFMEASYFANHSHAALNVLRPEVFYRGWTSMKEKLFNLEYYWLEHSGGGRNQPNARWAGCWVLNGAQLEELEFSVLSKLKKHKEIYAKEFGGDPAVTDALVELEHFRSKRIEWEEAQMALLGSSVNHLRRKSCGFKYLSRIRVFSG